MHSSKKGEKAQEKEKGKKLERSVGEEKTVKSYNSMALKKAQSK